MQSIPAFAGGSRRPRAQTRDFTCDHVISPAITCEPRSPRHRWPGCSSSPRSSARGARLRRLRYAYLVIGKPLANERAPRRRLRRIASIGRSGRTAGLARGEISVRQGEPGMLEEPAVNLHGGPLLPTSARRMRGSTNTRRRRVRRRRVRELETGRLAPDERDQIRRAQSHAAARVLAAARCGGVRARLEREMSRAGGVDRRQRPPAARLLARGRGVWHPEVSCTHEMFRQRRRWRVLWNDHAADLRGRRRGFCFPELFDRTGAAHFEGRLERSEEECRKMQRGTQR